MSTNPSRKRCAFDVLLVDVSMIPSPLLSQAFIATMFVIEFLVLPFRCFISLFPDSAQSIHQMMDVKLNRILFEPYDKLVLHAYHGLQPDAVVAGCIDRDGMLSGAQVGEQEMSLCIGAGAAA
jgi:hypothetical protein